MIEFHPTETHETKTLIKKLAERLPDQDRKKAKLIYWVENIQTSISSSQNHYPVISS